MSEVKLKIETWLPFCSFFGLNDPEKFEEKLLAIREIWTEFLDHNSVSQNKNLHFEKFDTKIQQWQKTT